MNDPVESAEVFVDGWVSTRDLASVGPDGYLRLLGRARDVIIVQATLVHAGPIERVLASDPAVTEAYVVARADDEAGERAHAYVVAAPGRDPDLSALSRLVCERLEEPAAPKSIALIDAVPVGPTGKPDKSALPVLEAHDLLTKS